MAQARPVHTPSHGVGHELKPDAAWIRFRGVPSPQTRAACLIQQPNSLPISATKHTGVLQLAVREQMPSMRKAQVQPQATKCGIGLVECEFAPVFPCALCREHGLMAVWRGIHHELCDGVPVRFEKALCLR